MSAKTAQQMLDAAKAEINYMSVEDAKALHKDGSVLFVDLRDSKELEGGMIAGAVHAPRGGLEFALDPTSELARPELNAGKRLVMVCGAGGRATLATKLAKDMGYDAVCLAGGFKAWKEAGGPLG